MSHFTKVDIQVRDIDALRDACAELGLELIENTTARGYATHKTHGDFVIKLHGPYDIALNREANGAYTLQADLWQGHVEKEVGKDFGTLKQLYGVHKTMRAAKHKGLTVRRQNLRGGQIRLRLLQAA
jgi:hypothetical protein